MHAHMSKNDWDLRLKLRFSYKKNISKEATLFVKTKLQKRDHLKKTIYVYPPSYS